MIAEKLTSWFLILYLLLLFQERHLLVKVIDRILYKLDDLVRPYVHKVIYSSEIVYQFDIFLCINAV